MTKLNYWDATWSLDEAQCPCDLHFVEYLAQKGASNAVIFHFGTGNHHIVGLKMAENGWPFSRRASGGMKTASR